jgi:hypothetical protein
VDYYDKDNKRYFTSDGSKLTIHYDFTLRIDPRGYFLMLRCATIIVIDKLMLKFGTNNKTKNGFSHGMRKPWAEICELLASYP